MAVPATPAAAGSRAMPGASRTITKPFCAACVRSRTLCGAPRKRRSPPRAPLKSSCVPTWTLARLSIGKNTCIINQKKGSWLFLGVILASLELEPDLPAPDRCGTCARCIEACPTDALIAPYQLDSNLCISYLTIEKRGEIPEEMRTGMGRHVFGCDICQDVCPWNRKAPSTSAPEFASRPGMVNPALDWLAEISEEEFRTTFRASPVRRAKRSGLRRNAVIAAGNSGEFKFLPLLEKLSNDEDQTVAATARWAREKISHREEDKEEQ
jgi:epoxyqueuosine reductase